MSYPTKEILALANATRAKLLAKLESGPKTVGALAAGMSVSRPAVSQHLRVLEQARLVKEEFQGRRHIYEIDLAGLAVVRSWLDRFWAQSLTAFAAEIEKQPATKSTHDTRPGSARR
jgi:DNA-binding transcriptional ArsR family regulator